MVELTTYKHSNVLKGTQSLFKSLDIHLITPSEEPIKLDDIIRDAPKSVRNVFDKIREAYFVGTIDDNTLHRRGADHNYAKSEAERDTHYNYMMVFAIDIKCHEAISRSDITALTRALNRASHAAPVALVVRYEDKISFSLCERTAYIQSEHSGEKPGKVTLLRDIEFGKPHRGHLDILGEMKATGISTFDKLYDHWMYVFSCDTLTKRFYQELSNWYAFAIQVIRFPNAIGKKEDDTKYNHEGVIRLITRLIFVWFLKRRGLIPEEFFDPNYIGDKLLKEFCPQEPVGLFKESQRVSYYYRGILQNLFFATLNCPLTKEGKKELTERRFKDGRSRFDINNLMRYRDLFRDPDGFIALCNKVPFLNGGLFDCLDIKGEDGIYYDGFSERSASIDKLCVPDFLFFSDNIKADLSAFYDDKKRKNETVTGIIKIFKRYQFTIEENTPLDQEVALDPELLGKVFENLLASFNPETKTTARKQTGSFYTPREIVQYMVDESLVAHLKKAVDPYLENEYRSLLSYNDGPVNLSPEQKASIIHALYDCKILDPACGSGAFPMGILQQMVHILNKIDPNNSEWKSLIQNAVKETSSVSNSTIDEDDNDEAVADIKRSFNDKFNRPDYARKLYLIENCIYGVDIQPIAIQISKLRFFISLVIDQDINDDPADNYGIRPLPNLDAKFVAANSLRGLSQLTSLGDTPEVKELKEELRRLNHKVFGARSWSRKKKAKQDIKETRLKLADELTAVGLFSESESNAMAQWDMFDQNISSDYFDPEWMFGVKDGFDIVIANPPYVQIKKLVEKNIYKVSNFQTFDSSGDLYCLFYEKANILLKDNVGIGCYITSNKWLRASYGKKLRSYFAEKTNPLRIIDLGPNVFESAAVDTNILIWNNSKYSEKTLISNDFKYEGTKFSIHKFKVDEIWAFTDDNTLGIKDAVERITTKLNDFYVTLNYGILTGANTTYILTNKQAQNLIALDSNNASVIKPILRGKDIFPYSALFADMYLLCLHNGVKKQNVRPINIKNYSTLLPYLNSFGADFKKRGEQGDNWYNLRNCAYILDYEKPKILYSDIVQESGKFYYDELGYYTNDTAFMITGANKDNLKYLTAILNSKLFSYCYRHFYSGGGLGKTGLRYKKEFLLTVPIPIPQDKEKLVVINMVNKILEYKQIDFYYDITKETRTINLIVFKLYGLRYDEVLMVDPETPITREEYDNFKI